MSFVNQRMQAQARRTKRSHKKGGLFFVALLIVVGIGFAGYQHITNVQNAKKAAAATKKVATTPPPVNMCVSNTLPQLALVSISKRHMWACEGTKQVYDSTVVTGMENLPADLTPTGTYHIYAKETNLYLNGSDSTGSWHDYVNYWLPFLDNQYGTYGFHDATWRQPSDFGNISPYSSNASHGCVELPLATAKWLYNWAQIGTTVTVQS